MRRALTPVALVACLSLSTGCGSSEEQPEQASQPTATSPPAAPEPEKRLPLLASYAGTWESGSWNEGALSLEVQDDGTTVQASLPAESAGGGPWERLELSLTRQADALVGTCTFGGPELSETRVQCELLAAQGGGLEGRIQTAWVDEDGAVLTFDGAPQWAPVKFSVRAPEPEPTPPPAETPAEETPTEEPPAEEPPTVAMGPTEGEPSSSEEPPAEETPGEEPTSEEPPPPDQPPSEEPPAEEPPSEEPPAEEPPSEEPPPEEPPAEEGPSSTDQPPAEPPSEPPPTEEPPPEEGMELEVDAAAAEAARKRREEQLQRQEEENKLRERRKSPEGLGRLMFEAVQKNDGGLFVKCLIGSADGLFLFASSGEQEVKLTYNAYNRLWRARASTFPDAAQGEFVRLEGSESQGKRAKEVREAVLVYTAGGQERSVPLGYLVQVQDGSWKAYRIESE